MTKNKHVAASISTLKGMLLCRLYLSGDQIFFYHSCESALISMNYNFQFNSAQDPETSDKISWLGFEK